MGVIAAFALGTALFLAFIYVAAQSAITIVVATVEHGKVTSVRGKLSARALGDLRDVVARGNVRRATIRIFRAKDRARVEARGLDPDDLQRLRNVVGTMSLAQLTGDKRRRS